MKTLARNLCHRPKSPSTNTRSTYGDNYRAPYTFIRGVHLAQRIPGAREREIKRRGVSRSPFFFPKRGISLSLAGEAQVSGNTNGTTIPGHTTDVHTTGHVQRFLLAVILAERTAWLPLYTSPFYPPTICLQPDRFMRIPYGTRRKGTVTLLFAEEWKTLSRAPRLPLVR